MIARPGRLRSIDVLRGCAALAVVAAHAFNHGAVASIDAPWFAAVRAAVHQGVLGVPLFFVISGFCIHLPWARRAAAAGAGVTGGAIDFRGFWARRLHRLYPPYFVVLCLSIGAVLAAWRLGLQIETVTRYPGPRGTWIGVDFLLHATMLHGFSPTFDQAAGNPPLWTLAREEYLYLMYFVVLAWRRRAGMAPALASVCAIGLIVPWAASLVIPALPLDAAWQDRLWHPVHAETSAVALWVQWVLGMTAVEACYGLIRLPRWCSAGWMMPVWAAAGLIAQQQRWNALLPVLWGMTFFTLVNYAVARETGGRWPSSRPFAWMRNVGVFSYSIYLVHSPLIGFLNQLEVRFAGGAQGHLATPAAHLGVWLAFVAIVCAAGWIFFLAVERHFLNRPAASTVTTATSPA